MSKIIQPNNIFDLIVDLNYSIENIIKDFEEYPNEKGWTVAINLRWQDIKGNPKALITKLKQVLLQLNINPTKCKFIVKESGFIPADKMEEFKKISSMLSVFKNELQISNKGGEYSLEVVEKTHKKIYDIVNFCKRNEFSPLECVLFAYLYSTKRPYIKEEEWEYGATSRSVYSVLNGDKIVCLGFTQVIQTILEALSTKNISVFTNSTQSKVDSSTGHSTLLIYIKDEKYGLDGYYFFDPTADCYKEGMENVIFLNSFLVPLGDISHSKLKYLEFNIKRDQEPIIKYPSKVKRYKPTREGYGTPTPSTFMSFGQHGLVFKNEKSKKRFCKKGLFYDKILRQAGVFSGKEKEEYIKMWTQLDENGHNENIEQFVLNNSLPLEYEKMTKLLHSVLRHLIPEKVLNGVISDTMAINTTRSGRFFKKMNIQNAFAKQYYLQRDYTEK